MPLYACKWCQVTNICIFRPCLSVSRYFIFINSSRNFIELYSHFVENFMLTGNNGCKFLLVISRHILILLMTVFFFQLLLCTIWSILVCTINIIHIILHYVSRKEKNFFGSFFGKLMCDITSTNFYIKWVHTWILQTIAVTRIANTKVRPIRKPNFEAQKSSVRHISICHHQGLHYQPKYTTTDAGTQPETIRHTFTSNHNIHKSSCDLCFWTSEPLIDRF